MSSWNRRDSDPSFLSSDDESYFDDLASISSDEEEDVYDESHKQETIIYNKLRYEKRKYNNNIINNEYNNEDESEELKIKIQSVNSAKKDYLKSEYRDRSMFLLEHLREVSLEMGYPYLFKNRYTLFMFNELLKISDTPNWWSNIRTEIHNII